jgi:hypothetical protein
VEIFNRILHSDKKGWHELENRFRAVDRFITENTGQKKEEENTDRDGIDQKKQ